MENLSQLLLSLALGGYALGGFCGLLCLRHEKAANGLAFGLASASALSGSGAALAFLLGGSTTKAVSFNLLPSLIPYVQFTARLDALGAFFVLVLSVVALAISIFSLGYVRSFYGGKASAYWLPFTTRFCWRRRWCSPRATHFSFSSRGKSWH
jgi:hydrogenase-4 component B